jgi:hypothetical protein
MVGRRNSPLLQAHPQDLIIGIPSKGVMTRSQKVASFVEHHSFISCIKPNNIEKALQDLDWVNAMLEELNNFTCKSDHKMQESLEQSGCSITSKMIKASL